MDISIDTKPLSAAIEAIDQSKAKVAYSADMTPDTLAKVLAGDPNVVVSTIAKAATFLGFRTKITFEPKNGAKKK